MYLKTAQSIPSSTSTLMPRGEKEEFGFPRTEANGLPFEVELTEDDIESMQTYQSKRRMRASSERPSFSEDVSDCNKRRTDSSPSHVMICRAPMKTIFSRNSSSKAEKEGWRLGRRLFGRNKASVPRQTSPPRRDDESSSMDNKSRKSQHSDGTEPTEETSTSVMHQIHHLTSKVLGKSRVSGKQSVVDQTPNRMGEEASAEPSFPGSDANPHTLTLVRSPYSSEDLDSELQIHQPRKISCRTGSGQRLDAAVPLSSPNAPSPTNFAKSRSDVIGNISNPTSEAPNRKLGRFASSVIRKTRSMVNHGREGKTDHPTQRADESPHSTADWVTPSDEIVDPPCTLIDSHCNELANDEERRLLSPVLEPTQLDKAPQPSSILRNSRSGNRDMSRSVATDKSLTNQDSMAFATGKDYPQVLKLLGESRQEKSDESDPKESCNISSSEDDIIPPTSGSANVEELVTFVNESPCPGALFSEPALINLFSSWWGVNPVSDVVGARRPKIPPQSVEPLLRVCTPPQSSKHNLDDLVAPVPLQQTPPKRFPALPPSPRFTPLPTSITVTHSTPAFSDDESAITLPSDLQTVPQNDGFVPLTTAKPPFRGLVSQCFGACMAIVLEGNGDYDDSIRCTSEMSSEIDRPRALLNHPGHSVVPIAKEYIRTAPTLKPDSLSNSFPFDENMSENDPISKSNDALHTANDDGSKQHDSNIYRDT